MASGVPCEPLAPIYSDASLISPKTSTGIGADLAPYLFYAKPNMYLIQVSGFGSRQDISAAIPPTASATVPESQVSVRRNADGSLAVTLSGGIVSREAAAAALGAAAPEPTSSGGAGSTFGTGEPNLPDSPNLVHAFPIPSDLHNIALKPAVGSPIQYVDYTGNDNNDGLSWGSAKASVMAAYDALPPLGGTIYIMQGPGGDGTSIPSTGTPGQGIWIMGSGDPNYSSPPPGWRRFKPNTNFIGVAGTSHQANAHDGGQTEISGGSQSSNQPCIWLSAFSGPLLFQNLKCEYEGRVIVIGETSDHRRDGTGSISNITFDNVAGAILQVPGNGPSADITGTSFWLYFNNCVFDGNLQAPSILDNTHAAMLIDGTGNLGNGLIFVNNQNTNGGGIKFIPGANGGSLTVDGLTEEGGNGTPAIYVTYTNNNTMFHFENVMNADPGPSGGDAVLIGGNGPPEAVLATGNLFGGVVGPATVMGQDPNQLANATESPAQMGQVGFFNGYVVGQDDAARRNFGPVAIRFPNIAPQVPTEWLPQVGISVTPGILAPDGTYGAGKAVDVQLQASVIFFASNQTAVAVGDYFIGGAWILSLNGGFAGSPTTAINFGLNTSGFSDSGSSHGAVSGQNQWSWQWFIYKVTSATNSLPYITFGADVGPSNPIEAYAPVLIHLPSGAVSDTEAYNIAANLSSYPDGLPSGTVATLRGQQFAFGGTGNFFGVLAQSNTANRTYTFPDADGTVALTNIAQNWSAPQTLNSPILTDPTIDGQKLDAPPIATFSAFLPGALSTSYTASTFTPDYGIVVTRVEITLKTASQGCSSSPVISLLGTNDLDVSVPLPLVDSGPVNVPMDAGTPVQILLSTPAQGCSIPPQDANVVVHYQMQ